MATYFVETRKISDDDGLAFDTFNTTWILDPYAQIYCVSLRANPNILDLLRTIFSRDIMTETALKRVVASGLVTECSQQDADVSFVVVGGKYAEKLECMIGCDLLDVAESLVKGKSDNV